MNSRAADLLSARSVDWQLVDSSNVHSALFADANDLYVRFLRSGPDDIYIYPNRSPEEWEDFRTAMSKGKWIWNNPRDENWPFELLTTRAFADVDPSAQRREIRKFLTPL